MRKSATLPPRRTNVLPAARVDGLLVEVLCDEVLVYDLDAHMSHCLDPRVAAVWRGCDGRTSAAELAKRLEEQLGAPMSVAFVGDAIARLDQARLLRATRNPRREWIKTSVALGATLFTITAPSVADAASKISNLGCAMQPAALCGGGPCTQNPGNTCRLNKAGTACSCL